MTILMNNGNLKQDSGYCLIILNKNLAKYSLFLRVFAIQSYFVYLICI